MLPVVAIVGRPNVGKSTLFNTLTQTRDAIVADVPGVTRDRQYGYGRLGPVQYVCIDTGGLVENPSGMDALMRIQTEHAIKEADRLIFIADARAGLTPQDQLFARELRRSGKPVFLAVNKAEGLDAAHRRRGFPQPGPGRAACHCRHARLRLRRAHGHRARGLSARAARRPRARGRAHPHRGHRPPERRQVHADQPADRRRAPDHQRRRRHHARQHPRAVRARRPRLHADRHRRRAPPREDRRRDRTPVRREDAAGDRRGARRHDGGRRAGLDRRAGRERARPRAAAAAAR